MSIIHRECIVQRTGSDLLKPIVFHVYLKARERNQEL